MILNGFKSAKLTFCIYQKKNTDLCIIYEQNLYHKEIITTIQNITPWMAISSNRTTIRNREQGSYCFTMKIKCQANSCLALYSIDLFEETLAQYIIVSILTHY